MLRKTYLTQRDRAVTESGLYKFACLCLSGVAVTLAWVAYQSRKHERTILVPPVIRSEIHIVDGKADDAYVRQFAHLISALALNYSPRTARGQFADLLALYAPESYPEAREAWTRLADDIETGRVTSVFFVDPNGIAVDERKREITLRGLRSEFQGSSPVRTGRAAYVVRYDIRAGRFYVRLVAERAS